MSESVFLRGCGVPSCPWNTPSMWKGDAGPASKDPGLPLPHSGELAYLFFNFCQRFDGDSQEIKGLHLKIHQVILSHGWKKCCFTFAFLHHCNTSKPTVTWCFFHSFPTETVSVTPQCCVSVNRPGADSENLAATGCLLVGTPA